MHRSVYFPLLALLGGALTVSAAHAADKTLSPYRLTPPGAQQQLYQRAPYQLDDRYRFFRPDDPRPFARQIAIAAHESGLDPELVHAVIAVESAYQPAAISPKGAVGLMQVMPETASSHGVSDPADVAANLRAGTRHLSGLMARFDNRLDLVLAAYNAGEGAVRRHGNSVPPYAETRNYVPAVIGKYQATSQRASTKSAKQIPARNYLSGTRLDSTALSRLR
ncbi:MAG: lytic transglycosylase domain-containing protein [Propionivibrio sp.]|nr:lytic transglycosylase domain-containing protein [Propionivibrio sp.]